MSEWQVVSENTNTWDGEGEIQGKYIRMNQNVGPNNSNQYVLTNEDGEVAVWGSTVLDNKFSQIPQGAEVKVKYLGKERGKNGNQYKNYEIAFRYDEDEDTKEQLVEFFKK